MLVSFSCCGSGSLSSHVKPVLRFGLAMHTVLYILGLSAGTQSVLQLLEVRDCASWTELQLLHYSIVQAFISCEWDGSGGNHYLVFSRLDNQSHLVEQQGCVLCQRGEHEENTGEHPGLDSGQTLSLGGRTEIPMD